MGKRALRVVLVLAFLQPSVARAEDPAGSMFSISGFGTLGLVHSSDPNADFVADFYQPSGAGVSHAWSADVDSRLGAQFTANFTTRISAVLQVISEERADGTYTPHVEWANLKYQLTPDLWVRLGRIALPTFLVSDSRKIGYSNPWVRPPIEVYSLVPVTTNDGADASYRVVWGRLKNTLQVTYGQSDITEPSGDVDRARHVQGASDTLEIGALTLHATYEHGDVTVTSINPLFAAFRRFGPAGSAIADHYGSDAKPFDFVGVGGIYDAGGWFVMCEWGMTQSHSAVGKRSAWYVSGGYRIGNVTPYVSYAEARLESNSSDPGLDPAAFPADQAATIAGLDAALNALLRSPPVQKSLSVGARWDFTKDLDLKVEFERIRRGDGSAGTLVNSQPGSSLGGTVNVFSAAVDFVF
jgi:hypothetical protein